MASKSDTQHFREAQHQSYVRVVLIVLGLVAWGGILFMPRPSLTDAPAYVFFAAVFVGVLILGVLSSRQVIRVDADGLHILRLLDRSLHIPYRDMDRCFGLWHWAGKSAYLSDVSLHSGRWALNITGCSAVLLELKNGRLLFIATRCPDRLLACLTEGMQAAGNSSPIAAPNQT